MSVYRWNIFREDGRVAGSSVYMLLCRDDEKIYIKVGKSTQPEKRFHSLRNGCPVAPVSFSVIAVPGPGIASALEADLHKSFDKWRVAGEWFRMQAADKQEFNQLLHATLRRHDRPSWKMEISKVSAKWLVQLAEMRRNYWRSKFKKFGAAYRDFVKDSA